MIERIQKILRDEYGLTSVEELNNALKRQKSLDIGIFVSSCGVLESEEKEAS